jgi:Mn2+/Fe2+ NRAMP family transporter
MIFIGVGKPVKLLIFAGAVNGLILPVALTVILVASRSKRITADYVHPKWMELAGWIVVILMTCMGIYTIAESISKLY